MTLMAWQLAALEQQPTVKRTRLINVLTVPTGKNSRQHEKMLQKLDSRKTLCALSHHTTPSYHNQ
jgi:hypothetical protein